MGSITAFDWVLWGVYLVVIVLVALIYRSAKSTHEYHYYLFGLGVKVFGGVTFVLIYVYYYTFGDTFLYHRGASILADTLINDPVSYFRLLFSDHGALPPDLNEFSSSIDYSRTEEEWFMVKLLSPIHLISFRSYLAATSFLSIISFYGSWKLFQVFNDILPKKEKLVFAAVFLFPTVVFWGGGMMKDTITLAAINLIIYHVYFSVFKRRLNLFSIPIVLLCSYLIFSLKAYILLAFIPGFVFAIYLEFRKRIKHALVRFFAGPVVLIALLAGSFFGLQSLSESSSKYNVDSLEYQVKGFHSWHTDVGGSTYNLGEIEYTVPGVLRKVPASLNVTYFRPYLWESRNAVVLITALESLVVLILFVVAIYKTKFWFFKILYEQPMLFGLFIYALVFGFAVGFTSYNFGALARYKLPVLSIFIFALIFALKTFTNSKRLGKTD